MIVELNAEPVPPNLVRRELFGKPLMIHPGRPGYLARVYRPRNAEARERYIMRSPARSLRLLTDAVLTLNDEWLFGCELEMKAEMFRDCVERLILTCPLRRPVPVPDAPPFEAGARDSGALAIQTFFVPETLPVCVCNSGMGEIEILYGP